MNQNLNKAKKVSLPTQNNIVPDISSAGLQLGKVVENILLEQPAEIENEDLEEEEDADGLLVYDADEYYGNDDDDYYDEYN